MYNVNLLKASGNLTQDIYSGYTQTHGIPFAIFKIAVDNPHTNGTTYMQGIAWENTAISLAKKTHKGTPIYFKAHMGNGYATTKHHDHIKTLEPVMSSFTVIHFNKKGQQTTKIRPLARVSKHLKKPAPSVSSNANHSLLTADADPSMSEPTNEA